MTTRPFDVVMLGGGNTGIAVTGWVRRAGMSVAMIEARDLGGARSHAEKDFGASWSRLLNKAGDVPGPYRVAPNTSGRRIPPFRGGDRHRFARPAEI
jgi:monoamine oxidase